MSHIVALLYAVHRSERTLAHLDLVSQGIFVENRTGKVEYANRAAREIGGGTESGHMPAVPFALDPLAEDCDRHQVRFNDRDLEVHRTRLPDGDVLVRFDDVTERNAAMAESKRMEALLEQSAKLQSMGQLAAGVAHDFNNILGAIMGFAQLLARRVAGRAEEAAFAERILRVCSKGKELTDEILAFARTSSVERMPIDLAQVVAGSPEVIPAETEGAARLTVLTPQERLSVSGNAAQLMQLIQNLVVNARHACEGNGGEVTVSAGRAERREVQQLIYSSDGRNERLLGMPDAAREYCYVRVADNGHGIAPENLDRIFEPFFTTKGRRRGSGLGLAVVHRVVEAHGGCCHVRSETGKGTEFTIYLPLLQEAAGARPAPAEGAAGASPAATHGTERVLIVDDDIDVAEAMMAGLKQLGYSATVFDDPQAALAAIRRAPDAYDVLVTDQGMPGMQGIDLVRAVRSVDNGMKIVLCSGADEAGFEQAAMAAGADAILHKPLGTADVAHRIRGLLRKAAADAA